jgi:flagellar biosynthetic protein FlhB
MAETSQERTEQATERRKREARKKGTVAKSTDLNHAAVTIVLLMVLPAAIGMLGTGFVQGMRTGFLGLTAETNPTNILKTFVACLSPALPGIGLIIAAAMGVGLTANFAQVGFMISPEAMAPNFAKLNPLEGAKRLLSSRALFDTGKASLKLGLFGYLAYTAISAKWSDIRAFPYISPFGALQAAGEILHTVGLRVAIVWAAIAGADYFFQRKQIQNSLMMSKQEVKQEHKEAEGSPQTRMARNIRRRKMRRRSMKQAVQSADVIITNPTHFAVAIKYDMTKGHAPIVVAKGQDYLAARIRDTAKSARIPIVANPPLARALYRQCEVGDFVPRELFQAVAEVLAYVYKTLGKMRNVKR